MKSERFVHRVIIKEAISDSSRFRLGRFYLNHMMGFSAIHQEGDGFTVQWAEFVSGAQGIAVGYVTPQGHCAEIGLEFSAVTSAHVGYRFFIRPRGFGLWPFLGAGVGIEVPSLRMSNGPFESRTYKGERQLIFGSAGLMLPLLDIGLKVELRVSVYGNDRVVFTQGVGAVIFF